MTNEEEKVIEWLKNTSLDELVQRTFKYIEQLEQELENFNELSMAQAITMNKLMTDIKKLEADKNKLINYIAIRENKTHEEVCKEFELGE